MSKVSIIMTCHNGEEYLRQAIKSIIAQTFKNWELIFFDNNSTDNTLIIENRNIWYVAPSYGPTWTSDGIDCERTVRLELEKIN